MKKLEECTELLNRIYRFTLSWFIKKSFPFWQFLGFHITPNHFYQPIPDTRTLKVDLWQKQSELVGIDMNQGAMVNLLSQFSSKFKAEYEDFPRRKMPVPYVYYVNNGEFESVDGEIAYCFIRYFKPRNIYEIGSGNSTYLSAQAIMKNKEEDENYQCELVAIEPYPNNVLRMGFPGLSKLIPKGVQEIPVSEFEKLHENDILFIDSSHILKIGSDVQYEYLEILPRVNKGVIVHIHDIFLPAEYPKGWVLKDHRFYNEQYILQAFLIYSNAFEVLWGGSYMHLSQPKKLAKAFSSYSKTAICPGSFWMRRK